MPDQQTYLKTHPFGTTGEVAGPVGYKVYAALISQSGTSAPTVIVLVNTLGGTLVWTYSTAGTYIGTLAGVFLANKVPRLVGPIALGGTTFYQLDRADDNSVQLTTRASQAGSLTNSLLSSTFIEIRVYF